MPEYGKLQKSVGFPALTMPTMALGHEFIWMTRYPFTSPDFASSSKIFAAPASSNAMPGTNFTPGTPAFSASAMFFITGRKSKPTLGHVFLTCTSSQMANTRRTLMAPVLSGIASAGVGAGSAAKKSPSSWAETLPAAAAARSP